MKLFDTIIQPILLYGSELWGIYECKSKHKQHILKFLLSCKHHYEILHTKICRNALGVNRKATEILVKAELGRYPLMCNILKNAYSYWQHILQSSEYSLVTHAIKFQIKSASTGESNYFSKCKMIFEACDEINLINKVQCKSHIKKNGNRLKGKLQEKYKTHFFTTLKEKNERTSGGRFAVYYNIKKNYKMEKYLLLLKNRLRRNITNLRISTHNLPIEALRKYGIRREKRVCKLCNTNCICTEFHVLMECNSKCLTDFRNEFNDKLVQLKPQWKELSLEDQFTYIALAADKDFIFYTGIFLDKIYKLF